MESITVPASLDSLAILRNYVRQAALNANLTDKAAYQLVLAVDEIASNIMIHGYKAVQANDTIKVWAEPDRRFLTVYMEDSGLTFDPRQVESSNHEDLTLEEREIGGLGIFLALASLDSFDYQRQGEHNISIFKMERPVVQPSSTVLASLEHLYAKVALADFSPMGHPVVEEQLARLGCSFRHIDGHSVLTEAEFKSEDLIILQLDQVEPTSYTLIDLLQSSPVLRHIPILIVAAHSDAQAMVRCIEYGVDDYLTLPLNLALFEARLRAAIRKKQDVDLHKVYVDYLRSLETDLRSVILPLGISLSAEKDTNKLAERILVEAKTICNADAGTLYIRTPEDTLQFTIVRTDSLKIALGGTTGETISFAPLHLYSPKTALPNYQNVATCVALNGQSINIPDIYTATTFDFSSTRLFDQQNNYRSISCLAVPLKDHTNKVIGVLQLLNAIDPQTGSVINFNGYQQLVVESLSSQAAVALNHKILLDRQAMLITLEHDFQTARQIQANFLPEYLPQLEDWDIAFCFQPAREVAGDFYDVFSIDPTRIGFVIADVCDKGLPASLFMALVRSLIRAFSQQYDLFGPPPVAPDPNPSRYNNPALSRGSRILTNVINLTNNYILSNHSSLNMFATLFFGIFDPKSGKVSYINAGHNPPAIIGSEGIRAHLANLDPAVGIMETEYTLQYTIIEPGETLFLYTDGITEARNPQRAMFGEQAMLELLEQPFTSAAELLNRIDGSVQAYRGSAPQSDDITMLALRRKPLAEHSG
jgi:sigma-B regulation protein RsbU (phosphoserine phosphatase)